MHGWAGKGEREGGTAKQASKFGFFLNFFFIKKAFAQGLFRAILTYLVLKLKPFFYLKKKKPKTPSFPFTHLPLYSYTFGGTRGGDGGREGKGKGIGGKSGTGGEGRGGLAHFGGEFEDT